MINNLIYTRKNLFTAPKNSILVQAFNGHGVMGAGIALETKKRYPKSYLHYKKFCSEQNQVGKPFFSSEFENDHLICGLVTSGNFGKYVDADQIINYNTLVSLDLFCKEYLSRFSVEENPIYSNQFNSGIFGIPWSVTENILKTVLGQYPQIKWNVCVYR